MTKPFLIAGLCVIESEELAMKAAETLLNATERLGIDFTFKASFDKANRTSLAAFRGPGMERGLEILARVKRTLGVKIATDIHEPWQAERAAEVADVIQIPAFLCRQTDLLVAAARTGKTMNIKKAQFLAPWDMANVVKKAEDSGARNILLCERGTSFGYNTLVVDMTSIFEMKKFGYPVVFDATHSVQKPGGNGTSTGGSREYARPLALAACAAGADGFFLETHPEPDKALSDGANSLALNDVESLLRQIVNVYEAVRK
jgi:2-dehydro-3-deoxyphosphooctonate aldolase (KDO 8-P synthase)